MVKLQRCMVNALVSEAEERRDKLRKASGRSKYPVIRGCLNGGTHIYEGIYTVRGRLDLRVLRYSYMRQPREVKHLST